MPDRYWVGGTDSWNDTAGSKWALTSGGAGGESVPTTGDDVFFDANSSGTVTIADGNTGAKSINCTGFTGTITGTAAMTVAGSITLVSGMTYSRSSAVVTITGTGTIISAGKTIANTLIINGAGITVTLGDAIIISNEFRLTAGTLDTDGYNFSCGQFSAGGTSTRSLIFNNSTITQTNQFSTFTVSGSNLTLNAGTSTLNAYGLSDGNHTLYDVNLNAAGSVAFIPGASITGSYTFNNLTITSLSSIRVRDFRLGGNQIVNGTFTCAGSGPTQRGFIRSTTIGTIRTITAAAVSADDCDFRDITIAGAAAPISPTRAGDCGNNSGITFPAAKTVYRVGTDTTWAGSNSWALTSGGTGSNDNFPLAQDTAVIDDNTALTGTLALAIYNIGSLDASTRTTGITLNHNAETNRYGSYTLGSGVTVSGTSTQTFSGRGTQTFTSAGKTITFPITVDKPAGAFELGDAFVSSNTITHTRGTFDVNNYNLTCTTFASSNSNIRTITMGSGLWTLSGTGTVWDFATTTNLTFNKDTADILLSDTTTTARTFAGGGRTYNKLTIGGATGGSTLTFTGGNNFTELASTKTVAHTVRFAANQGTIDTWSITGTSGNVVTIDSSVANTRRTFSLTNSTAGLIDYLSVKDIGVNQPNRFYVGDNSTNGGNNLNVYFISEPVLGTGNMFMLF